MTTLGKALLRSITPTTAQKMVTLLVATTLDPASIGPASTLLAMPGWLPGPSLPVRMQRTPPSLSVFRDFLAPRFQADLDSVVTCWLVQDGMESYANGDVRLLKHNRSIVREDDLDIRWKDTTGEFVNETIFLSKHTAVSNRPALTVHPIGILNVLSFIIILGFNFISNVVLLIIFALCRRAPFIPGRDSSTRWKEWLGRHAES